MERGKIEKAGMTRIKVSAFFFMVIFMTASCSDMLERYMNPVGDSDEVIETRGREFFVSFHDNGEVGTGELYLYMTGDTATTGQMNITGIGFDQAFTVSVDTITNVPIPVEALVTSNDLIENLGVHITTAQPVAVYGVNHEPYSTDSFLVYPVQTCGSEYYVISYETNIPSYPGSYFSIVAMYDDTSISITPSLSSGGHSSGIPYDITMNRCQTYRLYDQVGDVKDITGSLIVSDKPIAVFSGHRLCQVPNGIVAGNHTVEQLLPVPLWDTTYRTVSFMDRSAYTIRVVAAYDGTVISINGTIIATLNAGEYADSIISGNSIIKASNKILAAQYAHGAQYDSNETGFGDPSMLLIPSSKQYRKTYTFTTMHADIASNYINIIVKNSAISKMRLDGSLLESNIFSAIDGYYYGAHIPVLPGTHTITGPYRFGLVCYGFDYYDSYGNSGG
jgi:hypothetical protein